MNPKQRELRLWVAAMMLIALPAFPASHGPDCHHEPQARREQGQAAAATAFEAISIRSYGAWGNGSDETAKIQTAVTAASVAGKSLYWNPGNYRISSAIRFYSNSAFVTDCATCVTITNMNDGAWTFEYNSPLGPASYGIRAAIDIGGFTINARYGIKINSQWDTAGGTPAFDNQGLVLGARISNIIFNGKYAAAYNTAMRTYSCPQDALCSTDAVPSLKELKEYGIGVSVSGVFDSEVSHFQIQHAGIGIFLDHSDVNLIEHGRFALNARHIHGAGGNAAGTFLGSQNTIRDNDILVNLRAGGVALYGTHYYRLINNYFEETATAAASDTFVITENDQGTVFEANRFDSTFPSTAPLFILNPVFGQQWRDNSWNPAGDTPPVITIRHDYWNSFWPMQIDWRWNQIEFPEPDDPAVLITEPNRQLLAYNNCFNLGGGVATRFPWVKNDAGRWVLKSSPRVAQFTAPTGPSGARAFTVRFTGRRVANKGVAGGSYGITYIEAGTASSDYILAPGGSNLGMTDPFYPQTVEFTYALPANARGTGTFRIDVDNGTVELERIEVVPVRSASR